MANRKCSSERSGITKKLSMLMTLRRVKENEFPSHLWILTHELFNHAFRIPTFSNLFRHCKSKMTFWKFEFPLRSINSDFYCDEPFEKLFTTQEKIVQHFLRLSSICSARSAPIDAYELHSGYAAVCFIKS